MSVDTDAGGVEQDAAKARVFPCPSCGSDLVFDIEDQVLTCGHCAYEQPLEVPDGDPEEQDLRATIEKLAERHDDGAEEFAGFQEITCKSCGGGVMFSGTLTGTECPYCGSPIQVDAAHQATAKLGVDGVLSFKIEHDDAGNSLNKWIKSLWFAPTEFQRRGVKGEFQGVYLPYWTFDAATANRYSGQRGDAYYVTVGSGKNRRRVRRVRWSPASGSFKRLFDDVTVAAFTGMPAGLLESAGPWPFGDMAGPNQEMLAGFVTRTYDVELADGFSSGKAKMTAMLQSQARSLIGGDEQRLHDLKTHWGLLTFKHVLLPVWLLTYRFKDKPYRVIVNGATGRVVGERPWSAWKIAAVVLLGLVVAGGVFLLVQK
ncbi:MAG: hypothetical protein AAF532_14515 [Planctomycetota bacterium]